jgi:hypothetical protein
VNKEIRRVGSTKGEEWSLVCEMGENRRESVKLYLLDLEPITKLFINKLPKP